LQGVNDKVDDFLFTSPFSRTTFYKRRQQNDQPQHKYLTLYCVDYVFRIKSKAVFDEAGGHGYFIFDFYVLEDLKFDEYFLFENVWRETLLLHKFYTDYVKAVQHAKENQSPTPGSLKTVKVKQFGQMP
jgi:hypothetical protein